MVQSIPPGAQLRQRYVIQKVLGQGGFGRTYLAIDQERFNEPCVLKELVVPYHDEKLVAKSRSLFQREASILYQIQHPQVPRFFAAFEDEQRLFLVQSYIEGPTYRMIQAHRKQLHQTFSEAEIVQFLNHLLPVLGYLHEQDIIHRDLSPENLIFHTPKDSSSPSAKMPVLIDFGAVKEATSHWPLTTSTTRVGKVGYAPPEQLQTGKVYPNSDLYALAATCLALLTGKEPRHLLDSQTLSWNWQAHAKTSDRLTAILRKMLAVYPGDRFRSASEVISAIQPLLRTSLEGGISPSPVAKPVRRPQIGLPMESDSAIGLPLKTRVALDQLDARDTPAMGEPNKTAIPSLRKRKKHNKKTVSSSPAPTHVKVVSARSDVGGAWWKMGVISTGLVGVGVSIPLLLGSFSGVFNAGSNTVWVAGARMSQTDANRFSQLSKGAEPKWELKDKHLSMLQPARGARKEQAAKPLQIGVGQRLTVKKGILTEGVQQPYTFKVYKDQVISLVVEGAKVEMAIVRPNQLLVDEAAQHTRRWTGLVTEDATYTVQLVGSGDYKLEVSATLPPTPDPATAKSDRSKESPTPGASPKSSP